jgi:hypothetical protein
MCHHTDWVKVVGSRCQCSLKKVHHGATCTPLTSGALPRQPQRAGVRARHHVRLQRPGGRPPQLRAHAGRGVPRHRGRHARPAAAGRWDAAQDALL